MKKHLLILLTIFFVGVLSGCGNLESSKVNKNYVKNEFQDVLEERYGTKFIVEIKEFNENSDKREAIAVAYPKVDSTLVFEITGSIEGDCLSSGDDCFGSSYHTNENFADLLVETIEDKLKDKYSLEFGKNADLNQVGKNVKEYLKDFREMLTDYKDGWEFETYFDERFLRGDVPLTLNAEDYKIHIIIAEDNGKVIIDTSQGKYGWQGELEIADYLKYLSTGELEEKIDEIKCNNYPDSSYCKSS